MTIHEIVGLPLLRRVGYAIPVAYETTDAWAYMNVYHPVCAWALYRGFLIAKFDPIGFLNARSAAVLARNDAVLEMELRLEEVRRAKFQGRVSRMDGFFCFLDRASAIRAQKWAGKHFSAEFLVELSLEEAGPRRDRLDSNWITESATHPLSADEWMTRYWSGDPCPGMEPIWECLVDGRIVVLGTELRDFAASLIEKHMPDSVTLAEVSRLAALAGSDLGAIAAFARRNEDCLHIEHYLNMADANDKDFLGKLKALLDAGEPKNNAWLAKNMSKGTFGPTPDLRKWNTRILLHDLKPG